MIDTDKARKHGMDAFCTTDPVKVDHSAYFKNLQTLTLDHRLNDMFASLGWFSPGQIFVLDEPDGIGTVILAEKEKFDEVKERLRHLLEYQKPTSENHNGQPMRKIEDILHLAELCIDLLQQNDECYEEVLNDYLIHNPYMAGGTFHQQLKNMFAPLVVRYVDLMESSIAQSIHKASKKKHGKRMNSYAECLNIQSHGCAASEELIWKLDALQTFISNLHWPDEVVAKHFEQRLKLMAADMIESCVKRTLEAYEAWMQRSRTSTDFIIPSEICVMINVVLHFKSESLKLCAVAGVDRHQYHTKIDEFIERISSEMIRSFVEKFSSILVSCILSKLARYDEGSLLAPIFSFAQASTSGNVSGDLGRQYVNCLRSSMEQIRQRVIDELFILAMFEKLYTSQINLICTWLTERMDRTLHPYQVNCLSHLVKKTFAEFELQGIPEDVLNHKKFQTVQERMRLEEATAAVSDAGNKSSAGSRTMTSVFAKAKKLALS
ncbi:Calcium-dependent secretion activator [Hypsibius exemplaris]|uniref:Calcium-dependent secretion activator n=1 Tax=Hypsibius exemplaris TaxID=2072580 RepID=A0A1W0XEP2_HYPEX|nr:Calcium-dependent secretion activator [Hypsibius exemplaris]